MLAKRFVYEHLAVITLIACSCFLPGCSYKLVKANTTDYVFHSDKRREELITKYSGPADVWQKAYNEATTADAKAGARNDILGDLIWLANDYYGDVTRTLYKSNAWRDTLFDAAKLGLGAAGAVVGGADLKAILAATGTGIQGLNTSIDKNFYEQKTVESLVAAMDSQRTDDLVPLSKGMLQSANQYPLSQGLVDIQKYALDSTLTHALVALSKTTSAAASDSKKNLDKTMEAQEQTQLQLLARTHQAVDEVLKDSSYYHPEALRLNVQDTQTLRQVASERLALLRVAVTQLDSVLRTPFLPVDERDYFDRVRDQFLREASTLSTDFAIE